MNPPAAEDRYTLKLQGLASAGWVDWPCQLKCCQEAAEAGLAITILTVTVPDQSALHGLLEKIRDLNLSLISVERLDWSARTVHV